MNACFSYFLHDQFSLGGSDFSSFIRVWNEAPITSFIFCGDFGSTTIKLLHWHEISVFKTNINSCCISSQHFRVITTPVTRTSKIYFLVGCPGEKQTSECLLWYKLSSFLTPFGIHFALMMWQNAEKWHFNVVGSTKSQQILSCTNTCADKQNIHFSAPFHLKM